MKFQSTVGFQAGQRMGWTGFTWDKHLFPDPKMFLDWYVLASMWFITCTCRPVFAGSDVLIIIAIILCNRCKVKGLKNTLNLHPASGK